MSSESHAALPVPDFEKLPVEMLAMTLSSLDIQQLDQLIGYERNHSNRTPVLELLERRRDRLDGSAAAGRP
jgi:hypothetical protein